MLGAAYAVILAVGLLSLRSPQEPIADPLFSILELLIVVLAPLMVVVTAVVHAWAAPGQKTFSLLALVFMSLLAGLTCSVHFVILALSQQVASAGMPPQLLSFKWPSVAYAIDILAWDLFFGLSVLFAAPVFKGGRLRTSIRILMTVSGMLAVAGMIALPTDHLELRMIGVVGYAVVYPVAVALLAVVFYRSPASLEGAS